MADGTSRAGNALQKRQESLKRWKGSETDKQPVDRSKKKNKIKFNAGTVFLSAVSSGDVDEVKKLLAKGTDINFQNVDGLTALHQACIDETFDLVKILVTNGARLDIRDNEGWTPLHAAASCGSVEIAKYLIEKGADVAAVNNEGELPLDLAEEEDMEDILTDEIERLGIDAVEARSVEEKLMLEDAQSWLNKNSMVDLRDRTGATALHVAASKGYLKVMALLIQLNVDPNEKDDDGWTPLHAAAHWGQTEACQVLADNGGDFTIRNKVGQTPIDLAEPDMVKILEELKKRQNDRSKIKENTPRIKSNLDSNAPPPLKRRSSITRMKTDNFSLKDKNSERKTLEESRESPNVTKQSYMKKPNFPESPKEDKEREKLFEYGKNDSDSGSSENEMNSEEQSSDEDTTPVKPSRPVVDNSSTNSFPQKPIHTKKPVKYESSESEPESEEEQKTATTNKFSATSNSRVGGGLSNNTSTSGQNNNTTPSKLKSRFLDQDKDKKTTPFSHSKVNSRFDNTDVTLSSRLRSCPVRTTASTTSTSTTSTTSNSFRDRTSSATSSDKDETTTSKRKLKRVERSQTGYVAKPPDNEDDDEDNESKDNDVASKDASKDTKKDSTASSTDYTRRRNRPLRTNTDKSFESSNSKRSKEPEQNKENEEVEMSSWKKKRLEREREREQREREEKEKELEKEKEKEREKEKNKESDFSRYRRHRNTKVSETNPNDSVSRRKEERDKEVDSTLSSVNRRKVPRKLREERRGTGVIYMPAEESGDDSQESKKNEDLEHRSSYRRRPMKIDRDSDDSKSSERTQSGRLTPTADSRLPTSTTRDNTMAESRVALSTDRGNSTVGSRAPLSTTRGNTPIQITETDPKKLREQLQEAHLELQQYKVKLETTTQEKEKLEQKLTQLTEDLKQLTDLKNENQRLKDENGALIRVISKLSKPPT